MGFQIKALDYDRFAPLFDMTNTELAHHRAVRRIATTDGRFPCRVSLAEANAGDELILVNYVHQEGASPYRAAHAIYVRRGAAQARPAVGEVPKLFRTRMLSLRAFDAAAMIVGADLVDGKALESALESLMADPRAAYAHIHYATFGCYAARADRA